MALSPRRVMNFEHNPIFTVGDSSAAVNPRPKGFYSSCEGLKSENGHTRRMGIPGSDA